MKDPMIAIYFTALVSACLGYMACALMASRRIRRAGIESWREARDYYQKLYSAKNNGSTHNQ